MSLDPNKPANIATLALAIAILALLLSISKCGG